MALTKPNAANTSTPAFENPDNPEVGAEMSPAERLKAAAAQHAAEKEAAEKGAAPAAQTKPAASTSTAVATKAPSALQLTAAAPMVDPLEQLKDVFPVEWDTLPNVQLNQGNAIYKETGAALGDEIGLELLSFQDQTVVSPGVDGDEAKEHVRYSDDGITTTKGESVQEYLANLKQVYPTANTSKRVVIVGSLFDPGVKGAKIAGMKDKLVQINLAPTSVKSFKGYRAQEAFKIGKGQAPVEGVQRVRITCVVKRNGDNSYTVGEFTRYDTAA